MWWVAKWLRTHDIFGSDPRGMAALIAFRKELNLNSFGKKEHTASVSVVIERENLLIVYIGRIIGHKQDCPSSAVSQCHGGGWQPWEMQSLHTYFYSHQTLVRLFYFIFFLVFTTSSQTKNICEMLNSKRSFFFCVGDINANSSNC